MRVQKKQPVRISELVAVDQLGEHRDEHEWDRDTAWSGLGFAGLIERDVGVTGARHPPTNPSLNQSRRDSIVVRNTRRRALAIGSSTERAVASRENARDHPYKHTHSRRYAPAQGRRLRRTLEATASLTAVPDLAESAVAATFAEVRGSVTECRLLTGIDRDDPSTRAALAPQRRFRHSPRIL